MPDVPARRLGPAHDAPDGLFTDLYELTMAAAMADEGLADMDATFELFVRRLPPKRAFLVACGIETALDRLDTFTYDAADVDYLRSLDLFDEGFLERLLHLRVHAEVRAVVEGELVFAGEPILSITGPLLEVQLVETLLINTVGFESMIATKAALVTRAAAGRPYVDFSARRDHGVDAAIRAARAAYVGGAVGTSLVEAGRRYGITVTGTMAHSFVMAHDDEEGAFRAFLRRFGSKTTLLIDTYDTLTGARKAISAMQAEGIVADAVRIDSGDLAAMARAVRAILDEAGFAQVRILLTGDLEEDRIAALVREGVPVDAFGVGTQLGTSADAPYVGMVYKLLELCGKGRMKRSEGKVTLPGRKQVWRRRGVDVLALDDEPAPAGARPLLRTLWVDGARPDPIEPLAAARDRCLAGLAAFERAPEQHLSSALARLAGLEVPPGGAPG